METKQAALYKGTHKLIDEIVKSMEENELMCGKISKAFVVHQSVLAMHKKLVKRNDK